MRILQVIILMSMVFSLAACDGGGQVYAPVTDASSIEPVPVSGTHTVMPGETLYSIAWNYGLDYRSLAMRNHLRSPYEIHTGEVLYLRGRAPQTASASVQPVTPTRNAESGYLEKGPLPAVVTTWQWPAHGPVINEFSGLNKGINIGGHVGDPVYATAAGKVVYSGNGLRGYGNLIIIKHNSTILTAYAHNSIVYVKEGSWVQAGEKIAEMGHTGTGRTMLHFEIRRNGRSVNPLDYLAQR